MLRRYTLTFLFTWRTGAAESACDVTSIAQGPEGFYFGQGGSAKIGTRTKFLKKVKVCGHVSTSYVKNTRYRGSLVASDITHLYIQLVNSCKNSLQGKIKHVSNVKRFEWANWTCCVKKFFKWTSYFCPCMLMRRKTPLQHFWCALLNFCRNWIARINQSDFRVTVRFF